MECFQCGNRSKWNNPVKAKKSAIGSCATNGASCPSYSELWFTKRPYNYSMFVNFSAEEAVTQLDIIVAQFEKENEKSNHTVSE